MSQIPNPNRFADFCEFPDKKGFELPDGTKFFYDEFGGWFDEYKNYYNSEGKPSSPPKPEDLYEYNDYDYAYADEDFGYDEGFDDQNDQYDEFYHNFKFEQRNERSEKHLNSYPLNSDIIIEFSNMNFKARNQDIAEFFLNDYPKQTPNPIRNITIDFEEGNQYRKKGTGRIYTTNKDFAFFCIKKNGNDLFGRPLNVEIPNFAGESDSEEEVKVIKNLTTEPTQEPIKDTAKPKETIKDTPSKETIKETSNSSLGTWRNENVKKATVSNTVSIDSKEFKPSAEIKVKEENKAENIETLAAIKEKETPISDDPWDKPIAKPIPQTIVGQQNIVKKTAVNVNKKSEEKGNIYNGKKKI